MMISSCDVDDDVAAVGASTNVVSVTVGRVKTLPEGSSVMRVTLVTVLGVGLTVTRAMEMELDVVGDPRPRLLKMPAMSDAMAAACDDSLTVDVEVDVEEVVLVDVVDGVAVMVMVTSSVICSAPP